MLRDGLSPEGQAELDRVLEEAELEPEPVVEHAMSNEETAEMMRRWGGAAELSGA